MSRLWLLHLVCLLLLLPVCHAQAEEAPYARAYLNGLHRNLDEVCERMPAITEAADRAAEALIAGHGFGVRGDRGLALELSNRAGALMNYDGRPGEAGDVIVYVIGMDNLTGQLVRIKELKDAGSVVIGLGSTQQLKQLGIYQEVVDACDAWLDNRVDDVDEAHAPMQPVMNTATAWAFECELFAAMTRRDSVPVVRQSFETDTKQQRWRRYVGQRFHHDRWLDPIPPRKLGETYISSLKDVLRDIGTASWPSLARTVDLASEVIEQPGAHVWLRPGGRGLPYHVGGTQPHDPGLFKLLTHDGSDPSLDSPDDKDYVLAVGRHETAGSWEWGEPELLRQAGRGVTWIVNGYNTQPWDLYRNERLIDLWGPVGDCVVKVENYDTRLGPVSGVTGEAVLWMIASEVQGRIGEEVSADFADDTD